MAGAAKILLVDDEAAVCRTCTKVLAADGHEVSSVPNGDEALDRIENDRFDVAVLDLKMPGSGGLRVLRAIRKVSPQTEVVVVTGYPTIENAKNEKYPITRPLWIYSAGEPEGQAKAFLDWILAPEGQKVVLDLGYVPVGEHAK